MISKNLKCALQKLNTYKTVYQFASHNGCKLEKAKDVENQQNSSEKKPHYIHQVNYNFEQFKGYTKKVQSALKEYEEKEIKLKEASPTDLLPRRLRRKYDKPKHDLDITNYSVWRMFNAGLLKNDQNGYPVVCKIPCSPKIMRKVFGEGEQGTRNARRSTKEYSFEDVNNDYFLVYDWKSTTEWWGENLKNYDYENQEHIYPRQRKVRYPTLEEFWESDEIHEFRVNCNRYADWRKFRKWMVQQIEEKSEGKSFEEIAKEKYGEFEGYDNFNKKDYEIWHAPPVFEIEKSYWLQKGEKIDPKEAKSNPYHQKLTPSKQLDDKYLVNEEQLEELKKQQ